MTTQRPNRPPGVGVYAGVRVSVNQRRFIEDSVRRGDSGNAIQRRLIAAGSGLRRQAVQGVIREIRGREITRDPIVATTRNRRFGPASITRTTQNFKRVFTYQGRVRLQGSITGTPVDSYVRVNSDTPLTKGQVEDSMRAISERGNFHGQTADGQYDTGEILSIEIDAVYQRV